MFHQLIVVFGLRHKIQHHHIVVVYIPRAKLSVTKVLQAELLQLIIPTLFVSNILAGGQIKPFLFGFICCEIP